MFIPASALAGQWTEPSQDHLRSRCGDSACACRTGEPCPKEDHGAALVLQGTGTALIRSREVARRAKQERRL